MKTRLHPNHRTALTLLELIIASTMMTVAVTAVAVVLRGANESWHAVDEDHKKLNAAAATVRHIVRNIRHCSSVTAISPTNDASGSISLLMPNGQTLVWDHDIATQSVKYGPTSATALLAEDITELGFTAYKADGLTPAVAAADIQVVRCRARVQLPRSSQSSRDVTCTAWIRCW